MKHWPAPASDRVAKREAGHAGRPGAPPRLRTCRSPSDSRIANA